MGGETVRTQGENGAHETVAHGGRKLFERNDGRGSEEEDFREPRTVLEATPEIHEGPRPVLPREGQDAPESAGATAVPVRGPVAREGEPGTVETDHEPVVVRKREPALALESPEKGADAVREKDHPVPPVGETDRVVPRGDLAARAAAQGRGAGEERPGGEATTHRELPVTGDDAGGRGKTARAQGPRGERGGQSFGILFPVRGGGEQRKRPPRPPAREVHTCLESAPVWIECTTVPQPAESEGRVRPEFLGHVGADDETAHAEESEIGHLRGVGPEPNPEKRACASRGAQREKGARPGANGPGVDCRRHTRRRGREKSQDAARTTETLEKRDGETRPTCPGAGVDGPGLFRAEDRPGEFGGTRPDEGAHLGGSARRKGRRGGGASAGPGSGRREDEDDERRRKSAADRETPRVQPPPDRPQTSSRMRMALPVRPRK